MTDTAPVALITGSARRIGAAIARQFHAGGWSVVLHAHTSTTELQQMAFDMDMLRPGSVLALQADLRDADALPDLIDQTVAQFGRLDSLVNNASNFYPTLLGQITAAQWDDLFAVNARAPLLLAQAAAPHLRRQQGSIVNLTDLHGTQPMRDHPVYAEIGAAAKELGYGNGTWDAAKFVDDCEAARGTGTEREELLKRVQAKEIELIAAWCAGQG